MMKLIKEITEDVKYLEEENSEGKKNIFIEGVFLQGDIPNRNHRKYPMGVLDKAVKTYNENYISTKRAFGELNHPTGPGINLDRISHMIESLTKQGSNYVGRAKLMDTPMGNIAKNIIKEGGRLGVSSRGLGSLKENKQGIMEVQDDFYLATAADIVADPSAPDAFVNGIYEGAEWVWNNGVLVEQAVSEIKRELDSASIKELNEAKVKAFKKFLSKL